MNKTYGEVASRDTLDSRLFPLLRIRKKAATEAPTITTKAPIIPPTMAPVFELPFNAVAAEIVDPGTEAVSDPLPATAEAVDCVGVPVEEVGNDVAAPKLLGFCIVIVELKVTPVYTICRLRSVA